MPSITDVPIEVLLDNLLPSIPVPDLLNLGSTSRFFALLCADDTFWKRKLQADFNFSGEGTARTSGWKFLYRGLSKPKVFTWGENSHGRLGLSDAARSPDIPFPTEIKFSGIRIVSLVAGGMSFHALDSVGHVYVWGTLDATLGVLNSDGFSEPGKMAPEPLRLQLPTAVRSVSCGRLHSAILDTNLHVWTCLSWGRPFRLLSPLLDCLSPESTPVQIECGWTFSSVLTGSGDVLVWWPFHGPLDGQVTDGNVAMDSEGGKKANATSDGVIPCITWEIRHNPHRLAALPNLPPLGEENKEDTRLIKIAALDNNLIGLTNKGHVLKYGMLANESTVSRGSWQYLPLFSEVRKVRDHPAFSKPDVPLEAPQSMRITHISAHFRTFIAYSTGSSSIVLMGSMEDTPQSLPTVIPALQHKSVISVVLGDYHYGALTSTGKLFTWGAYSRGALGLGDPVDLPVGQPGGFAVEEHRLQATTHRRRATPPPVEVPTEVRFNRGKKDMFCYGAAAAGWHMGALVVDMEPNSEAGDDDVDSSTRMPGHFPSDAPPPLTRRGRGHLPLVPSFRGGGSAFRIGFAGRGRGRG